MDIRRREWLATRKTVVISFLLIVAGVLACPAAPADALTVTVRGHDMSVPTTPSPTPSAIRPYDVCSPHPLDPELERCLLVRTPPAYQSALSSKLESRPASASPLQQFAPEGGIEESGLAPPEIRRLYRLPSAGGSGQTVAVVDAFNDPNIESDLSVYRSAYGLPPCTTGNHCFRKLNQNGVEGSYPPNDVGWSGEIALDVDMISAVCPSCHIMLVESTNESLPSLGAADNTAAAMGATEISDSWAEKEFSGERDFDPDFMHPGVPVVAGTGDWGYGVYYPASSPYVVAVGGTEIGEMVADDGSVEWFDSEAWESAGSGCSAYEPKPVWQTDTSCPRRMVADISAMAGGDYYGPASTYDSFRGKIRSEGTEVEVGTGWEAASGTSVATPIIAATYALSNSYTRSLGAQALYAYRAQGGAFNDILSGSNGSCGGTYFCTAKPGFDGPTGLGTPSGVPIVSPPAEPNLETTSSPIIRKGGEAIDFARTTSNHLVAYARSNSGGWSTTDVTSLANGQPTITGDPVPLETKAGELNVFAHVPSGELVDFARTSTGGWIVTNISSLANGHPVISGDPEPIETKSGELVVFARVPTGELVSFARTSTGGWIVTNITGLTAGHPLVASAATPLETKAGELTVVARLTTGELADFARQSTGGWIVTNITGLAAGHPTIGGNPEPLETKAGELNVLAHVPSGELVDFARTSSGGWIVTNISSLANGHPSIAGNPAPIETTTGEFLVFGRGSTTNNLICFGRLSGGGWTAFNVTGATGVDIETNPSVVSVPSNGELLSFGRASHELWSFARTTAGGWSQWNLTSMAGGPRIE